jgi:hypothetical protein
LFNKNYISLHFGKTHYAHFKTRNSPYIDMKIAFNYKLILNALSTKFLGLTFDGMLSWRMHIDHPATKLASACYVIRSIKPLMCHKTLLLIYHSLFHTGMSYGKIFWGNSCHSIQFFWMQRELLELLRFCGNRDCCRILLKKLIILPLTSECIVSIFVYVGNNRD